MRTPEPTRHDTAPAAQTEPGAPDAELLDLIRDAIAGSAFIAAANIVMQLSRLPVGHGVARSRVDGGRVDLHPLKRARTTTQYLIVALLGDPAEQRAMRHEVNRSHRQVRSLDGDPVAYDAFDRGAQLWVAACLYVGFEQYLEEFAGGLTEEQSRTFYRHSARLGTTLQVREDQWPADRAAFQEYWDGNLAHTGMDEISRPYLQDLTRLGFLPAPIPQLLGPAHRFMTLGFLPEPFRTDLGLRWTPRDQRAFDRLRSVLTATHRRIPRRLRQLPLRLYERDLRRRIAAGRPIV